MTRILFFGDLAPTGFGTVTMDLGREMLALGHDVRFVSQNEVDDLPEPFDSRTYKVTAADTDPALVSSSDPMVQDLGVNSLSLSETGITGLFDGRLWWDGWTPEAAIVLGDFGNVRLLAFRSDETRAAFSLVPTFHYVPIEGIDLPPRLAELWTLLRPVAMTEFGATQIEKVTGTRPPMVYHGVDTEAFRPFSADRPFRHRDKVLRGKDDAKRAIGADPKARIILRTDRNMPRKRYPELFRSLAPVLAQRPDTYLVIHCLAQDLGGDLDDLRSKYPKALRSKVIITNGRVSREDLIVFYNAADLYVSNSAEGFGLTIAEALACGVPAIGLDYSAVPEVIGPGGVCTPVSSLVDNEYGYFWAAADQKALAANTARLIDDPAERKRLGRLGREHVKGNFQWSRAALSFSSLVREATQVEAAA